MPKTFFTHSSIRRLFKVSCIVYTISIYHRIGPMDILYRIILEYYKLKISLKSRHPLHSQYSFCIRKSFKSFTEAPNAGVKMMNDSDFFVAHITYNA